jgi:ABC-type glycerol-3-phosphate transport system permease component
MHVALLGSGGSSTATTTTAANGTFTFANVGSGDFRVQITAANFRAGFNGIFFLGTQSLTPTSTLSPTMQAILSLPIVDIAMIIAYLWIWAGFAMVVIGAGLAALNREVLEAAQIDGASEWQTLRRVTVPMLRPVLVVVFVTMLINVLKIFDIILNMAAPSSQAGAATLAVDIYNDFSSPTGEGLAAALAVVLFVLVVPAMLFNLKRIRGCVSRLRRCRSPRRRKSSGDRDCAHRESSSTSCSPRSRSSGWCRRWGSSSSRYGPTAHSNSPVGGRYSRRPHNSPSAITSISSPRDSSQEVSSTP